MARRALITGIGGQDGRIDESLQRGKAGAHELVGDLINARRQLGWEPSVGLEELVRLPVDSEPTLLRDGSPISALS